MKNIIRILFVALFLSTVRAQVTGLSGWNIYLDPGHSQTENMGIYGYSEAEKNLGVALALRDILQNETDIDAVYMSRTNSSQYVSLSQRTDQANKLGAAWYHSLHSNAGSSSSNTALLLWGQYENNTEKNPHGGKAQSDIMVDNLAATMRIPSIGSWGDHTFYGECPDSHPCPWLWVNYATSMPSELSEAGYHTNARQNQLNMNADWKRMEARGFYWSILQMHGIARPPVHIVAGIVKDVDSNVPINNAKIEIDGRTYITDTYQSLFHKYTTDSTLLHNGFYYFEDVALQSDSVQVIVSAKNHYSDTARVKINPDFFTFHDVSLVSKTPPVIVSTNPVPGDTAFSVLENITLHFSRPMDRASVDSLLIVTPAFDYRLSWGDNDKTLTLRSDSLKFLTAYHLSLDGRALDRYGHALDGNGDGIAGDGFEMDFTTANDQEPPRLIQTYPEENRQQVELLPLLSLRYDEVLDSMSITEDRFKLERFSDHSFVPLHIQPYRIGKGMVVDLFPLDSLDINQIYIIRAYPGVKDRLGNATTGTKSVTFKTGGVVNMPVLIDNFEDGAANWWEPGQSGSTTGVTSAIGMEVSATVTNLLTGSHSAMAVHYGWDAAANDWLIREYLSGGSPRAVHFNAGQVLQVYVFGDGSGNLFRFAVDDHVPASGASNHEVSPWYVINWLGWKLVSWNMADGQTGTWLGDGVLDGTLRFDSIQLSHTSDAALSGTVYFDDLQVVTPKDVSAVTVIGPPLPVAFKVYPNYPNPFNPSTWLRFSLPQAATVQIDIYSVLGRRVKQYKFFKPAGWHKVKFDGNGLPSGIYLYHIRAGHYRKSGKMILAK